MSDKIVLLEFNDEVESFLDYCQEHKIDHKNFKIIALSPKVQVYLKRKNIDYENTLKYFNNESHERCLLKSEELYQLLKNTLQLQDGTAVKEGYNNFVLFHIRFFIHHLLNIIEILFQISEKNEIDEIYCCIPKPNVKESVVIKDSERYVGLLAKKYAELNDIVFKEIPCTLSIVSPENNYNTIFGKSLLQLIDKIRLKRLRKKAVILLTTTGYNFDSLAQEIKKELNNVFLFEISSSKLSIQQYFYNFSRSIVNKNYVSSVFLNLYYPRAKKIEDQKSVLIQECNKFQHKLDREFKNHFAFHSVPFYSYLVEKLDYGILPSLIELQAQTFAVETILDILKPKLLISPFSRDIYRNIAELTNEKEIPSICISHGSLVPPKNELEKIDHYHNGLSLILNNYNYHCIQTPLAREYIKYYPIKGKTIETGNLIFSKIQVPYREKVRQDIGGDDHQKYKIIVHGNTQKSRASVHFHWIETFDEYVSGLIDIINAVNKIENTHLIIRPHPALKINEEELKLFLPKSDKYTINKKDAFYQVLSAADLVMSFGSTSIEDACQNRIPVLLYDKWGRYKHCEALDITDISSTKRSLIYYINQKKDLQKSLSYILTKLKIEDISHRELIKYVYLDNKTANFYKLIKELLEREEKRI